MHDPGMPSDKESGQQRNTKYGELGKREGNESIATNRNLHQFSKDSSSIINAQLNIK